MKFLEAVEQGLKGLNKGVYGGLPSFDKAIYNTQHGKIIGIAGEPKSGKTSLTLMRYIAYPDLIKENIKIIYYSLEMSKNQIIAKLISQFACLHSEKEVKVDTSKKVMMIQEAKILGMGEERLNEEELEYVKLINSLYIEPLFGKEDDDGNIIEEGVIEFIEDYNESNPTGIFKHLKRVAEDNGVFSYRKIKVADGKEKELTTGYKPNPGAKKIWVIIDHLGLMKKEAQTVKENIDLLINIYAKHFRNICGYTFILISQFNRTIKGIDRFKLSPDQLQPQPQDIKDSQALEETADIILAIFNPNSHTHIDKHFGYELKDFKGTYRSIHCILSRYTPVPVNKSLFFNYKTGLFRELKKPTDKEFKIQLDNIKKIIG